MIGYPAREFHPDACHTSVLGTIRDPLQVSCLRYRHLVRAVRGKGGKAVSAPFFLPWLFVFFFFFLGLTAMGFGRVTAKLIGHVARSQGPSKWVPARLTRVFRRRR